MGDSADLLSAWDELDTASVADALDAEGLHGAVIGLQSFGVHDRVVGLAYTVRYLPGDSARGSVGDYIDDVDDCHVVVIDNGGRIDCTVWGGILSEVAVSRGVRATVIDGACRDVAHAQQAGYRLFARARHTRTGKDRCVLDGVGVTVRLGDVRVDSADIVIADADGVVVVPARHQNRVHERALKIQAAEATILESIRSGTTLAEARRAANYFGLQRKHS